MLSSSQFQLTARPSQARPVPLHRQLNARANAFPFKSHQPEVATQDKHESDKSNVRIDDSVIFAHRARQEYARAIQGGEAKMNVASAALWASAEDDALAHPATPSQSKGPFDVTPHMERISAVAAHVREQLALQHLLPQQQEQPAQQPSSKRGAAAAAAAMPFGAVNVDDVLTVVEKALFASPKPRPTRVGPMQKPSKIQVSSLGFKTPSHGRSALPNKATVDHTGKWEVAKDAYVDEALLRRTGHPAVLAIIYSRVMSELFADGSVDFAVSMDVGDFHDPPTAVPVSGVTRSNIPKGQIQQPPVLVAQAPPQQPTQAPQDPNKPKGLISISAIFGGKPALAAEPEPEKKKPEEVPYQSAFSKVFNKQPATGNVAAAPQQAAKPEEPKKNPEDRSFMEKMLYSRLPTSTPGEIPIKAGGAALNRGQGFNTCTSEVLAEQQRHLKRAYWCWEWDGQVDAYDNGGLNSLGGFRAAAKAALDEETNPAIVAWRLQKGVFNNPGKGDMQRARAACERLVMLRGAPDQNPEERRDLAVLLIHCGDLAAARAELGAYMITNAFVTRADPTDRELCKRLQAMLTKMKDLPKATPLTVDRVLATPEPKQQVAKATR